MFYGRAAEIAKRVKGAESEAYAAYLNNLAYMHELAKEYEQALSLYNESSVIRKKACGAKSPEYAESLNNLAGLYEAMGEPERAIGLYRESLDIKKTVLGENHPDYAISLSNLAGIYWKAGDWQSAEPLLHAALDAATSTLGATHPHVLKLQEHMLLLLMAGGRKEEALRTVEYWAMGERHYLLNTMIGATDNRKRDILLSVTKADIAYSLVFQMSENLPEAAKIGFDIALALKGIVLEAMLAETAANSESANDNAKTLADLQAQWQALLYSPEKNHDIAVRIKELDSQIKDAESDLAKNNLSFASALKRRDVSALDVFGAIPEASLLVDFVRYNAYDFAATGNQQRWKGQRYGCFVVRQGTSTPIAIDLGDAQAIDKLIMEYRKLQQDQSACGQVNEDAEHQLADLSHKLFERLICPIQKLVPFNKYRNLIVVPDGGLLRLPFEALDVSPEPGTIRYLAEEHIVSYIGNSREIGIWQQQDISRENSVVIGAPDYNLAPESLLHTLSDIQNQENKESSARESYHSKDSMAASLSEFGEWTALPGAEAFCISMSKDIERCQIYTGARAIEDVAKSLHRPRILVFATHGFYLSDKRDPFAASRVDKWDTGEGPVDSPAIGSWENPLLRSGLVFAGANHRDELLLHNREVHKVNDGILTALEVATMDLQGTDLVAMLGCETGLGDIETGTGISGLRSAFLTAGAQSVLATLWQVPLNHALPIGQEFLNLWLRGNRRKAEALNVAINARLLKVRSEYGTGHPAFWAGIILVGKPY